jgi:hypothetical protein
MLRNLFRRAAKGPRFHRHEGPLYPKVAEAAQRNAEPTPDAPAGDDA